MFQETVSSRSQKPIDFVPIKGELQLKLLTPRKIILFWEASSLPAKILNCFFNLQFEDLIHAARIYDVTEIQFNGRNAHHYYEIPLSYDNGYWMIKGLIANRSYLAHLGVKFTEREFFPLLQSNIIHTPTIDIPFDNGIYHDLLQFQTYEDKHPKWIEHVSTYSYYQECSAPEGENG
jgi:hypothetical protein